MCRQVLNSFCRQQVAFHVYTYLLLLTSGVWVIHARYFSLLQVPPLSKIGSIPQATKARHQYEILSDLAKMPNKIKITNLLSCGLSLFLSSIYIYSLFGRGKRVWMLQKEVQVGKDQEKAQSEKDSHSKNRGGKKPN